MTRPIPDDSPEADLVALVPEERSEATIAALRDEGVYDDTRSVVPADGDRVALPLSARPTATSVEAVTTRVLPSRGRDLETLLRDRGWDDDQLARAPSSWAVVGSVILVQLDAVPSRTDVGEALLQLHSGADTVLERHGISGPEREPDVSVLAGLGETETVHREHGTAYALDLAQVMFSPGNKAERARMGRIVEPGEHVFDMFAGIGYFALPMARAGATVTATEINATAYRYLVENTVINEVSERIRAYLGDCREVEVTADRVVMGHYRAHDYLDVALEAVVPGGSIHVHAAVPEAELPDRPVGRLERAAARAGRAIDVTAVRDVKGYSAGVRHVVVDGTVDLGEDSSTARSEHGP